MLSYVVDFENHSLKSTLAHLACFCQVVPITVTEIKPEQRMIIKCTSSETEGRPGTHSAADVSEAGQRCQLRSADWPGAVAHGPWLNMHKGLGSTLFQ